MKALIENPLMTSDWFNVIKYIALFCSNWHQWLYIPLFGVWWRKKEGDLQVMKSVLQNISYCVSRYPVPFILLRRSLVLHPVPFILLRRSPVRHPVPFILLRRSLVLLRFGLPLLRYTFIPLSPVKVYGCRFHHGINDFEKSQVMRRVRQFRRQRCFVPSVSIRRNPQ